MLDDFQDPGEEQGSSWAAVRRLRRPHVLQPSSYLCFFSWAFPSLAEGKVTHKIPDAAKASKSSCSAN